ncbi:sugar phosphate isomerase/epimerase [Halobacteria archaeon AArc-dxtr1]|nr:sugar phosphate isomerase/epimerase [Halobacteria archaeon AArc-dxtr1]
MKFGFSMNAFLEDSLQDGLETLGELDYDGVEILLDEPHLYAGDATDEDIEQVHAWLEEYDLEVSNCNAFMLTGMEITAESAQAEYSRDTEDFHHPSFLEPVAEDRQKRVEHTKNCLRVADKLGSDYISITPGGPIPKGTSEEEAMELFLEGLHEVTPTAEEVGVDVLVEPEPELLIETSEDFLAFMENVESDRVACNFDAGHFYCVDEDPAELVEVLHDYSPHYHLEDIPADGTHVHTQLGEGGVDIDGFLQALEDRDYDGFVTIELYPYAETPKEAAAGAMEYLEDHGWV